MVDGININSAVGQTVTRVVRDAAPSKSIEGGKATESTKAPPSKVDAGEQLSSIKSLVENNDGTSENYISRAEDLLTKALNLPNTRLSIEFDDSGLVVYKGIDKQSGEVVSQFPNEEILSMIAYFRDAEGLALDKKV